jgi:hypothetical protein
MSASTSPTPQPPKLCAHFSVKSNSSISHIPFPNDCRWYREYERIHFPDPQGLRLLLEKATFGLYPGALKAAMAVFDIPEAVAVTRTAMCAVQGSLTTISRLQVGCASLWWRLWCFCDLAPAT